MSIFTRITGKDRMEAQFRSIAQFLQQAAPIYIGFNPVVYPAYNTKELIDTSFNTNIDFYAVIKRIAQKFGHLPRYEYSPAAKKHISKPYRTKALDEAVVNSDLSKLIQSIPNDAQSADQFFESVAIQYLLTGEVFIWKNRGGIERGRPVELYVLPSAHINVLPEPSGDGAQNLFRVGSYQLEIGVTRIPIPKEDIIHWKTANPNFDPTGRTHLRGFNPLEPQKRTLTEGNEITDAGVQMLQNGGSKGILYKKDLGQLTPEQEKKLKAIADKKINNKDLKAAVTILEGEYGYHDLGMSSVDMQLIDADEKIVKKFCNANGLPYELFQSDTTFANKKEAWYFFITNTLMPMAASLDAEMTRSLIPDFKANKGNFIATDFSELPEMQDMRLRSVEAAEKAWWLTPNERRMMMMDEPLPMKEMEKVYIPSGFTPIDEMELGKPQDNPNQSDYED